jgi:hypothetical protein
VPTAIRTALGSCLAIEASYHRPTRSRYEQHPPGRSKAVRTAVGRSIFPADEIGRFQRQRPETTRPQVAAHRKAEEKPAGLSSAGLSSVAVKIWASAIGKDYFEAIRCLVEIGLKAKKS